VGLEAVDRIDEEEVYQDSEEPEAAKELGDPFDSTDNIPINKLNIDEVETDKHKVDELNFDEHNLDEHNSKELNSETEINQHNSDEDEVEIEEQTDQHSSGSVEESEGCASSITSPETIDEYIRELAHSRIYSE